MITWLFTQVWLWSLAAFLVGAFVTWALFVRPLRRRLKEELNRPHYDEPVYDQPVYDETVYDEPVYERAHEVHEDEPVTEHRAAPLDLLDQRPGQQELSGDQFGEWDRRPRPWVAPGATTRSDLVETQRVPEPEPEAAPVPEPEPEPAAGDNTWFRNPEFEETRNEQRPSQFPPGADEEPDQLSGQLRSLFEPESAADSEEPYTPPVGADATQVIPAVPDEQKGKSSQLSGSLGGDGAASQPLPKRTPQPRGDAAQADRPHIPDSLRQRVQNAEPLSRGDQGDEAPAEIKLVDNPDDSAPLPRRTPGAGPHPGRDGKWEKASEAPEAPAEAPQAPASQPAQSAGSTGPMIKGHSASRQYHTPESPHYDQITADVWFRNPSDAETAGFEPWNRTRR